MPSLVPDISNTIGLAINAFGTKQQRDEKAQQKALSVKADDLIGQLGSGEGDANQIMAGLAQIDPKLVTQVKPIFERRNQKELADTKALMEKKKARAVSVLRAKDDAGQIRAIQGVVAEMQAEGAPQAEIDQAVALANLPIEQRTAKLESELLKGDILNKEIGRLLDPAEQETFKPVLDSKGNIIGQKSSKTGKIVSDPRAVKTEAQMAQELQKAAAGRSTTNVNVGNGVVAPPVVTPPELLKGLPPNVAEKVDATFRAAGGGKDGINAIDKVKSEFQEEERRQLSGKIVRESFPNATEQELKQLEASMDSASSTESGLKLAATVRAEQKRLTKAAGFQDRAIALLERIVKHPELDDVTGAIEGSIDLRLSDSEAELIADIEEAGNILTADNLDLMTGVLSETDIQILKNLAGGALNRKRGVERFKTDVGSLINKLSSAKVETVNDEVFKETVASDGSPVKIRRIRK